MHAPFQNTRFGKSGLSWSTVKCKQNPKEMSTQIGIDIGFGSHYVVRVNSPAEGSTEPVIELVPNESKEVENR